MIFGVILIFLALMALNSDEPAAQTDNGRMGIAFAAILGMLIIVSNAVAISKDANAAKNPPLPPPPPPMEQASARPYAPVEPSPKCPSCGKEISSDFVACPYCGTAIKRKCPSCSKMLSSEYVACPYCGVRVGKA
jgi:DNA-directed RNA polymerase subunit RPC12/RpoP